MFASYDAEAETAEPGVDVPEITGAETSTPPTAVVVNLTSVPVTEFAKTSLTPAGTFTVYSVPAVRPLNVSVADLRSLLTTVVAGRTFSPPAGVTPMFSSVAFASDIASIKSGIEGATDQSTASTAAQNIVGSLLTVAKTVAVGVALIMLAILAIKYMAASAGDKAEIKKHAVVYVTGAVILFASSAILSIIENFAITNITASNG